jgi:hypothetical protein
MSLFFFWAPCLELKLSLPNNKNQGKCGEFEPYFHTSNSTLVPIIYFEELKKGGVV